MVMLTLDRPVLIPEVDDGQPPLFLLRPDGDSAEYDEGMEGEVRDYAGGQRSSITRLNSDSTVLDQVVVTDAAGLERIRQLRGTTVLYRDGLGVKLWGTYHRHPWVSSPDGRLRYVTLRLHSLTVSEAV